GKPVKDLAAFLAVTRALKPGEKIDLAVERDGKEQKVVVQLASIPPGVRDRRLGWSADLYADLKDGVPLTEVPEDSPAGEAGVKKGAGVTAINGEPVPDAGAYAAAARALQPGDRVTVTAVRDGKPRTFEVVAGNVAPPRPPGARFGVVAAAGDRDGVLVQS